MGAIAAIVAQRERDVGRVYLEQIDRLSSKIAELEKTLRREAQCGEDTRRLQTMPGIGPITAMAVEAFAPPMTTFKRGRDFAAWLGLIPVQHSTAGKQRLGRTSKMGQRDIRRLLIIGAMAVIQWASRRDARPGSWRIVGQACNRDRLVGELNLLDIGQDIAGTGRAGDDDRAIC